MHKGHLGAGGVCGPNIRIDSKSGAARPFCLHTDSIGGVIIPIRMDLGPIAQFMDDDTITEVMVNGPEIVYIERDGRLERTDITFRGTEELMTVINRIVSGIGRSVDATYPYVDARLPDGSRVNAAVYPVAVAGPYLTIRKRSRRPWSIQALVDQGSLSARGARFLTAAVADRRALVVSGGAGAGKTTILNALSAYISPDERVVVIEDASELRFQQPHVLPLETRPMSLDGEPEVTMRQLVRNSLRMRPDRIIVGEVRGGEALDMLQAINTGHAGSMTTVHANGTREALSRLESMCLMAGLEVPVRALREQMTAAIDLLVHVARTPDGRRRIVEITELAGMEQDTITLQQIFRMEEAPVDGSDDPVGLVPTGLRPLFLSSYQRDYAEKMFPTGLFQRLERRRKLGTHDPERRSFPVPPKGGGAS